MPAVRRAVFPIAGLGTRFLPATKASPKEMLPVVDRPLIQYAVEEAYEAGVRHMVFVTGRTKRSVEDHFDTAYELESELERTHKSSLLAQVRSVSPPDMVCSYVRQPRALGLGHAVLCARELVGREPFAVLLADDLMVGTPGVTRQLVAEFQRTGRSVVAVERLPTELLSRYGVVAVSEEGGGERITKIVEKPARGLEPSNLAVMGRYVFSAEIFQHLEVIGAGAGGEIQLTDAMSRLVGGVGLNALRYEGRRYDCGSKLGFLQATVALGEAHDEVGEEFSRWLASRRGGAN